MNLIYFARHFFTWFYLLLSFFLTDNKSVNICVRLLYCSNIYITHISHLLFYMNRWGMMLSSFILAFFTHIDCERIVCCLIHNVLSWERRLYWETYPNLLWFGSGCKTMFYKNLGSYNKVKGLYCEDVDITHIYSIYSTFYKLMMVLGYFVFWLFFHTYRLGWKRFDCLITQCTTRVRRLYWGK